MSPRAVLQTLSGAGLRRVPRPFFVAALLSIAAGEPAAAQDPMRPWLDWRTIETANYRFHFPAELESWTRDVAEHVESVDSALASLVGYTPSVPIHVVVDDPFGIANGYALPFIDQPVSVWWAVPADPRSLIGNYRSWGEILAVHELSHVAHLSRPSRNPLQRRLWASLPANVGPIMRKAPRWVFEGYATLIEGRVTGSGRPNAAWRPAMLRQWAIEGQLPTYAQLSSWSDFRGESFAYLGGSAYLEWLTQREGDTSLVSVWRRLSARRVRSFGSAFAGVYGDSPDALYGLHAAELTRDAMAARTALERAGLVEGTLVQRLSWETGDPAMSPNGSRAAIMLSERDRPARVVVWATSPEPVDTAAVRKRLEALARDPQDVADRRFYPRVKHAVHTLAASNGRPFESPRWLADNEHILLTRWSVLGDGSQKPDLYIWDPDSNTVRRLTHGASLTNADPHPDMRRAIATQCHRGHCDVAQVDLDRGATLTLLEGDPHRSYYRPRYSASGSRFAASVSDSGRWRVVVANRDGSEARVVGPDDDSNRYDAEWLSDDTLVVVSERGGVPNLERLCISTGEVRTLTRVTGAAIAPVLNPADSSIWFLSLHARGLDVRRLARDAPIADSAIAITADRFGFAGVRHGNGVTLATRPISATRAYGAGPRHQRWLPGAYQSGDGAGGFLSAFSGDIVGRFNIVALGAYGTAGTPRGGALRATWRFPRPALEFGAFGFVHEPSRGRQPMAGTTVIDAALFQALAAATADRRGDGWRLRARVGGGAGQLDPTASGAVFRGLGFGEAELQLLQMSGALGVLERLRVHYTEGHTNTSYRRATGGLRIVTTGRDAFPLDVGVTLGRVYGSPEPFELFAVGGESAVADSALLSQRLAMPVFPTGVAIGDRVFAWRVALPGTWTWFYEGASAAMDSWDFRRWNRAVGVEARYALPPVPATFSPRIEIRGGAAYTLDAPFRRKVRGFLAMRVEP